MAIAENFILKQKYMGLLMIDTESVNLLNPSFFHCDIRCYESILKLKSFSNLMCHKAL